MLGHRPLAVDVPIEWDVPLTLEVPELAPDAVYQSPEQVTIPVASFDPTALAEPVIETVEPANTIVIGGTDIFGSVPTSGDVATIDMGGIGTFDNLSTADPGNS